MFKSKKKLNFAVRINALRVIERLERMNILGGQNTESVKAAVHHKIEIIIIVYGAKLRLICYRFLE